MTNDSSENWRGHDPDVLDSLANERNGLAWQRTALSWVAAGVAVARYFSGGGLLRARTSIGWMMVVVGTGIWAIGNRTYRRHAEAIRSNAPTSVPTGAIALVVWTTTFAIGAILAVEITRL